MCAGWLTPPRRSTAGAASQPHTMPAVAPVAVFACPLTQAIQPSDRVILLDERGRDLSSEDLARLLAQVGRHAAWQAAAPHSQCCMVDPLLGTFCIVLPCCRLPTLLAPLLPCAPQASDQSWPSLVFCIGGPFGHSPAVRARGNETIRLSKMVLNHQARQSPMREAVLSASVSGGQGACRFTMPRRLHAQGDWLF